MNLSSLCENVCSVAKSAGDFIRSESQKFAPSDVELKGRNNLVSYVDKKSEEMIVSALDKLLPGSGFITEENTVDANQKEITWIIDPLDGTTNFVHKLPCYCVSIGMLVNGKLSLGVIYELNLDEMFYGYDGGKAMLNGKSIKVSSTKTLADSLIATGFPYTDYSQMNPYIEIFRHLMLNSRGLRRMGSAAVDLAYVACGRFDSFYEYGLNAWDVAAGAFLVQLAGGKNSDFSGGENFLFGKEIITSNGLTHAEMLGAIRNIMEK